jgi:hypothetical protein
MIEKIKKYRLVSLLSLGSLALAAGGFFWALGALSGVASGPLILHFNDMAGITSIGGLSDLILIGILGIVIVIVNFFIALDLEARNPALGKIVAAMTLIMAVLLFLAFAAIIKVN